MEIHKEYAQIAEKILGHVENRTTDQTSDVMRVPVDSYLDPEQHQREIDLIFKRVPLMLALSIELPKVDDYKAMEVIGLPVLITRAADGKARAFLNVCKHRAMHLAPEGRGSKRRFACKYHGWTYANDGKLMAIAEGPTFGEVDKSTLNMTELPCEELAGMIFVALTPGLEIDARAWLGGFYDDLAALKLETWYFHKTRKMQGANWKVAYDGYLEGYHFQTAHANTVAPRSPSNRAAYSAFGPHLRIAFPQHKITRLHELPKEEWGKQENNGYDFIRLLFPNVSFFLAPEMCQFVQLLPGPKPNENTTLLNYCSPNKPESEEALQAFDEMCDFFYNVVLEEDYALGLQVQNGLESGATTHVTFGRNEPGNQYFHRWLDYYMAEPGSVPKPVY